MATVTDIRLQLADGPDDTGRWSLSVHYSVAFERWEHGTWFEEQVSVFGIADQGEQLVAGLTGPPFQAPIGPGTTSPLSRRTPTVQLEPGALDVSPGLSISVGGRVVCIGRLDQLFAEVRVSPLGATTGMARSPVEARQFGASAPR